MFRSLTITLAVIGIPQLVFANPTSTTTYTINTRLNDEHLFSRTGPDQIVAAGLENNNGLTVLNDPSVPEQNIFSARSSVPMGGGSASVKTGVTLGFLKGIFNEADTFAKATIGDSIKFTNSTSKPQVLHLQKTIFLDTVLGQELNPPSPKEPDSSETINRIGKIFGDGIDSVTKESKIIDDSSGFRETGNATFPGEIDFNMDFTVGEEKEFNITLSTFDQIIVFKDNVNGFPFSIYDLFLNFSGGGTLTDVATGKAACGVTATSASGFDYLKGINIAACQVDGGGDGGNGGNGAGDVPEPASWALMLGGFGMVGGAIRTARRKTTFAFN